MKEIDVMDAENIAITVVMSFIFVCAFVMRRSRKRGLKAAAQAAEENQQQLASLVGHKAKRATVVVVGSGDAR